MQGIEGPMRRGASVWICCRKAIYPPQQPWTTRRSHSPSRHTTWRPCRWRSATCVGTRQSFWRNRSTLASPRCSRRRSPSMNIFSRRMSGSLDLPAGLANCSGSFIEREKRSCRSTRSWTACWRSTICLGRGESRGDTGRLTPSSRLPGGARMRFGPARLLPEIGGT